MKECPETQIKNTRRSLYRLDAEKALQGYLRAILVR